MINLTHFRNPSANCRPMPLWNWNGKVTKEFIHRDLKRFQEEGFGGVFIHPRAGLETEYLSEEWFELWEEALKTARELGMQCNIYDENTYPSASAGGNVFAEFPYACAQYAMPSRQTTLAPPNRADFLATYDMSSGTPKWIGHDAGAEGDFLVIELRKGTPNPWAAWFPFVDTCQPQVAETFIALTHENYFKRFGKSFGNDIRYVFADEPTASKYEKYEKAFTLPLSRLLIREFERDHGYELTPLLCDLFVETKTSGATRFDYYMTLQRVWTQNFLRPISEWCEQHNVAFTGHMMEHEWPFPVSHPNTMDAHRWFQVPGVDMLGFQYNFNGHHKNISYLLMIKEAASVADQFGRERTLSETHGGGGHELRFEQLKELCDWQMVHGIDLVNPHMSFETIAGARKYDWPQTFSDHSPWFEHYRIYADYTARLTEAITSGQRVNRTLLLHPTSSAWLDYSPMNVKKKATKAEPDTDDDPTFRSQAPLIQLLADRQIDFDLGDELILRDIASASDGKMVVGQRTYDLVVLPEGMKNLCDSTLGLIEAFLESGGTLLALRDAPSYVNGREDSRPAELQKKYSKKWQRLETRDELIDALRETVVPRICQTNGAVLPERIYHQYREIEDGSAIHMLVNNSPNEVSTSLRFAGKSAVILDPKTGDCVECPARTSDGFQTLEKTFAPLETLLLLVDSDVKAAPITDCVEPNRAIEAKFEGAEPDQPNTLVIDYCDLVLPSGRELNDICVMEASEKLWNAQGFDQNLWDRTIQFRNIYSRFSFDDQSGFSIRYHFHCETVPNHLQLAVERPHLYTCTLNGKEIDFSDDHMWLDEEIRRTDIRALAQAGENLIELKADRFDLHCEIDRIYLTGAFSTAPAEKGFSIGAPIERFALGDWTQQGLCCYRGGMTYRFSVEIPESSKHWKISLPDYDGTLALIALDGKPIGHAAFPPYSMKVPAPSAGRHELKIKVIGDLRNLFGAHFTKMLPQYFAWRVCPANQPPGSEYQLIPQGLNKAPTILLS